MQSIPKEIKLSNIRPILSRTDLKGKIVSCNEYFTEISGYTEEELKGANHNIIRHEDTPKVIFKLMWSRLKNEKDILALVKNKSKSGDYYWVTTKFEIKYNVFDNRLDGYLALRKAASSKAVKKIEPLYKQLLKIEKESGIEASEAFLKEFLEKEDKSYDEYISEVVEFNTILKAFFHSIGKVLF